MSRSPWPALSVTLALLLTAPEVLAQSPDKAEPGSVEAIKAATTEARFITPWVSYIPDLPARADLHRSRTRSARR